MLGNSNSCLEAPQLSCQDKISADIAALQSRMQIAQGLESAQIIEGFWNLELLAGHGEPVKVFIECLVFNNFFFNKTKLNSMKQDMGRAQGKDLHCHLSPLEENWRRTSKMRWPVQVAMNEKAERGLPAMSQASASLPFAQLPLCGQGRTLLGRKADAGRPRGLPQLSSPSSLGALRASPLALRGYFNSATVLPGPLRVDLTT